MKIADADQTRLDHLHKLLHSFDEAQRSVTAIITKGKQHKHQGEPNAKDTTMIETLSSYNQVRRINADPGTPQIST